MGFASLGRFLQWMLAKLFLTVEALEERQLIRFSKRDEGEHKRRWLGATPQESRHVAWLAASTSILVPGTARKGRGDTNTRMTSHRQRSSRQ